MTTTDKPEKVYTIKTARLLNGHEAFPCYSRTLRAVDVEDAIEKFKYRWTPIDADEYITSIELIAVIDN